jgi:alanine-glyoxylate transaminase/serine-glyoxylate transaminase/serine-pyruvate transaminase
MRNYQLSLPGPCDVDPRVLQELLRPNLPHYGDLWVDIYRGTIANLKKIYRTSGRAFILPSSGSGAIDAAFGSLGAKRTLILNNGNFGARLAEIARHQASRLTVVEKGAGEAFPVEQVEEQLRTGGYDLLAMVHGETSTGMLNQLEGFSDLCRRHDVLFLVDAVSTLGGVPLEMDKLGIDFCVSASQKALGGLPGLSTIAVSERGWSRLEPEGQIKGWYLNLRTWERFAAEWGDWHPYPVTLPVHLFFVLAKALELLLEEGLAARWLRHEEVRKALQEKLLLLDIPLLIGIEKNRLATTTAATLPPGFSSAAMLRHLRENQGILIAGGVGPLRERIFRIGHMAFSAQQYIVNRVAAAIKDYLQVPTDADE